MSKRKIPQLVVERAEEQGNYFFLSVLEFRNETYLVIVDNITEDGIGAYVLDFAQQEGINLRQLISIATCWFYRGSYRYPLSFEFSRLGLAHLTNRIYKNFELAHVTRLIGNDFRYEIAAPPKIKRRRVSMIPAGVEVKLKRTAPTPISRD
ncbi:hypothetical protein [Acinetobacter sp.]|uniref:hypothetical protein n=1 Tax=Acinetobacter sp. TaxID=472 RepID=UPI00388EE200